ncbi:hypothetical protein BKA63DRAFT_80157 [Paraphoma chrysanthemicola]|nr:hypothetical protein BKA63DRAFT_80157 [Paraphoma chrysanthemicola]
MLSPNDIAPKSKAASIWSFDSGYGSNTLEDDEPYQPTSSPTQTLSNTSQHSVGLGISAFWNVHVEDQLRLRRSQSPIDPVVTKVNVFTAKESSTGHLPLPTQGDDSAYCVTCQFWCITNPGQGTKCNGCQYRECIRPEMLHVTNTKPKPKLVVPRLEIPKSSRLELSSARQSKTRCSACELAQSIDPKLASACSSCARDPKLLSPSSPCCPSTVRRSCAKRPTKLPQHALHGLRAWLREHRDDPYPSPEVKRTLAQQCGITEKQVTTWFTNTRARKLPLPNDRSYPNSEDDGTFESDLSSISTTPVATSSANFGYSTPTSHQPPSFYAGPSTSEPAQLTLQTSRRGKKKDYRRLNTISPIDESPVPRTPATPSPNPNGPEQEMWHCTFCYQALVPKSWRRHEETQHRPKYQWTCLATHPRIPVLSRTGTSSLCAFCSAKNPSDDHFQHSHRIAECSKKSETERTFGRPDHLRQHVKNFHRTSLLDMVRDKWRKDGPGKNVHEGWTCGFCAQELKTWDNRETHIANHFKDGVHISAWQDYPQATSAIADNNRRRSLREDHAAMMAKLKNKLLGRSNRQPEYPSTTQSHFSNTFAPFPASTGCSNMIATPVSSAIPTIGLGVTMPDTSMADFDFSGASTADAFDAGFPAVGTDFSIPFGSDAMPMDYETMVDTDLYGNFIDYQGDWEHGLQ